MKNKILFSLLSLIMITSCATKIEKEIELHNKQLSIYVASDIHLLSNNLISESNTKYTKDILTPDGRDMSIDYELVNSLVNQVNKDKPEYLVLTGDLTFNGEKDSHIELKRLLSNITDTKILVIPGNHDTNYFTAKSYINDTVEDCEILLYEDFANMYEDFGYNSCINRDSDSLSYFYKFDENNYGLLLDTTLNRYNFEENNTFVGGFISEITLSWIEENLKFAKENNINVISFSHHNSITHNKSFENLYTIHENQNILDLFEKYNVKLNMSGHLHIQSIKNSGNVYDIASGSLLDYGNRYGVIDIYEDGYNYDAIYLNSDKLNIQEHSFKTFYDKDMIRLGKTDDQYSYAVHDLSAKINAYYFAGEYTKIHQLKNENKSLIRKMKRNGDSKYVISMLDLENKDQTHLRICK